MKVLTNMNTKIINHPNIKKIKNTLRNLILTQTLKPTNKIFINNIIITVQNINNHKISS